MTGIRVGGNKTGLPLRSISPTFLRYKQTDRKVVAVERCLVKERLHSIMTLPTPPRPARCNKDIGRLVPRIREGGNNRKVTLVEVLV